MENFLITSKRLFHKSNAFTQVGILGEFLLLFLPIVMLVSIGTWSLGESRINTEMSMLMADEKTFVELSQGRLARELAVPIRHMISLANEKPVRHVYEALEGSNAAQMEEAFISLMSRNPNYDKVRWIDDHGLERVRVNNSNGQPQLVLHGDLQDKHDRYFFIDALRLEKGEIYISPLDLNMENGQFELPYKPTIRVATRIFAADGTPRGILIINQK